MGRVLSNGLLCLTVRKMISTMVNLERMMKKSPWLELTSKLLLKIHSKQLGIRILHSHLLWLNQNWLHHQLWLNLKDHHLTQIKEAQRIDTHFKIKRIQHLLESTDRRPQTVDLQELRLRRHCLDSHLQATLDKDWIQLLRLQGEVLKRPSMKLPVQLLNMTK